MRCSPTFLLFATLLALPLHAQPAADCATRPDALSKTICESPELRALKQHYELMVVQIHRANPGAQSHIDTLSRDKVAELQARCKSKACASQWYSDQINLQHAGKWLSTPGDAAGK